MITKEELTTFFKTKVTRPISFRDILVQLGISPTDRRRLRRLLREVVNEGELIRTRKGLYGPPEEMSLVTGYFEAHRDGYGFLVQEKPGERDIFIPGRKSLGAMDNDRVVARIENPARREGRIIRILERAHSRIVGTLEEDRGFYYVKPKNKSIPFDLYIAPSERGKAKYGETVVAEVISFPSEKRPPAGRVVKVLKKPQGPQDEIDGIIDEFSLPRKFPHEVLEEARMLAAKGSDHEGKRTDVRALKTVTIDGERAKDFDDAISIAKENGAYRLWVHIADVGHYVKWDSVIDLEARDRGTSVYFPDRVIPMLPKELSEDLCSLKPKVDRLAFSAEMEFDSKGNRLNAHFYPSIIKSDERMTYTSVKKILVDRDVDERARYDYLLNEFERMGELCNILKERRLKRGSLDFDLPEPEVILDIQGNPEAIVRSERNFAHMIIEEFMIAANEAVSEHLERLGIPSLYRVHEEPDLTKMDEIARIMHTLGIYKGKKEIKPDDLPEVLRTVRSKKGFHGSIEEDVINHLILRSLKQARYSPVNVCHFGLASECYTHFTSPIRRYPDLVVHRILREVLQKKQFSDKRVDQLNALLPDLAFNSSRMERRADDAEREVIDAMRAWFMKDKVGEEYEGKVVSVTPYGVRVRLKDYYVEGFLHVSYMTDDFYQYDEKTLSLIGIHRKKRYSIGKELTVRIDKVDTDEREIVLGV